nr:protein ACCELERATED CELL DEATH 6-like [Ipomoea batatas]
MVGEASSAFRRYESILRMYRFQKSMLYRACLGLGIAFLCGMYITLAPLCALAVAVLLFGFCIFFRTPNFAVKYVNPFRRKVTGFYHSTFTHRWLQHSEPHLSISPPELLYLPFAADIIFRPPASHYPEITRSESNSIYLSLGSTPSSL